MMTFSEFRNALRILHSIDRQDWMGGNRWENFRSNPFQFLMRADDEEAERLWRLIVTRMTRGDDT